MVVVLGHAGDKLLPAHKGGLRFPRLERPGEVFVDRPLIIRKLVHAAKAEGLWQEAPDIGVSGRPAETLDPRGPHPDIFDLNAHHFDRAVRTYDILECSSYAEAELPIGPPEIESDPCCEKGRGRPRHLTNCGNLSPEKRFIHPDPRYAARAILALSATPLFADANANEQARIRRLGGGLHIFIDESGTFTGTGAKQPAVSVIGALVIASHRLPRLLEKYAKLRLALPKRKGEVKGSQLDEKQVAAVVELLRKNGALFFASMIDLGSHTAEEIANHRDKRSASLSGNLTDKHSKELRNGVADLQRRLAGFPEQLYVQGVVMTDLLYQITDEMIVYHCQRFPKELQEFHWIVDAKNPSAVTDWEDWWSNTIVIWLQSMSLAQPGSFLPGGDYRHFRRFMMDGLPDYVRDANPRAGRSPAMVIDLQKMYRESFSFSSDPEPGLELVDIVTNALRRGLIGNLGDEAWLPLRGLMIHRSDTYVNAVGLGEAGLTLVKPLARRMNHFRTGGRSMSTRGLVWPEDKFAPP